MGLNIRFTRLKIVEQIAIVLFFAVVIPMTISGIIINNINQQSVRLQLKEAATLIANMVSDEVDVFQASASNELNQIVMTLDYFNSDSAKLNYLSKIQKNSDIYKKIFIINSEDEFFKIYNECINNQETALKAPLKDGRYLVAIFDINVLREQIFSPLKDDKRQINILTYDGKIITSHNYNEKLYKQSVSQLPKNIISGLSYS